MLWKEPNMRQGISRPLKGKPTNHSRSSVKFIKY
jgi:hypothetical protein